MEVMHRRKKTEIGVIPEDWKICRVHELVRQGPKNGYSGRSGKDDHGTPTLSLSATSTGRLILDTQTVKYLEEQIPTDSELFLRPGDILVQRSNTIDLVGTTAIFTGPPETFIYPDLMMRLRFRNLATAKWFWLYANSLEGRRFFKSIAAGSTGSMPKISGDKLREMRVPIPSLAEQEAITEALSDADALIDSMEKLIAKKRLLKQGVMAELLTGKRRLPGFGKESDIQKRSEHSIPEDWVRMPFIQSVQTYIDYRGRTPKKLSMAWGGGSILALSANNVQMGKIDPAKDAYFGSEELYRKWMVQGDCELGDILLTMEAPLGNVAQIPDNNKYILSQRVLLIKPKPLLHRDYLAHYMRGEYFQMQLALNSTGSTAKGIQRSKLDEILIFFPSLIVEQEAILKVLNDIETEIASLMAKLDKLRLIKQGMMQNLLTGRIRLVRNDSSEVPSPA